MSITPIDRRDLHRLLKGIIHGEKREDVKVEVKYYVQFFYAADDDMSIQTLIDPYSGFDRPQARYLVKNALASLDKEYQNAHSGTIIANTASATADSEAPTEPLKPAEVTPNETVNICL